MAPEADVAGALAYERRMSPAFDGRTVFDREPREVPRPARRRKGQGILPFD